MNVRTFAVAATLVVVSTAALAADSSTSVTIPWGDWVSQAAGFLASIAATVIAWAVRKLPARYSALMQMTQAEQLLEKAVGYGLNAVAGASKGKTLSIDVGNAVVQQAATYVIANGPAWLISWLGGEAGIAQKIVARLTLEEAATVVATGSGVTVQAAS